MYWDWKNQKWTNTPTIPYWRTRCTPEQLRQYDALTAAYARIHEDPEYQRLLGIEFRLHWKVREFRERSSIEWAKYGEVRCGNASEKARLRLKAAKKAREDYQAAFDRTAYERTLAELKRAV